MFCLNFGIIAARISMQQQRVDHPVTDLERRLAGDQVKQLQQGRPDPRYTEATVIQGPTNNQGSQPTK